MNDNFSYIQKTFLFFSTGKKNILISNKKSFQCKHVGLEKNFKEKFFG